MRPAATAGLVVALAFHGAFAQHPAVHVLEQGEFLLSDDRLPPPDDAPWRPVTLPDNWFLSHPGATRTGWYRLPFDLAPESAAVPHSIFLPRNSATRIRLFFNAKWQGGNLPYGEPGARNWAPPLILTVASELLRPGGNVLQVRVVAVPGIRQGLPRVVLAEGYSGRTLYERRYAMQVMTLLLFGAAALLCALLAAGLWLRERSDAVLLWLAITAFAWAAAAFPGLHGAFTPREFFHGALAFTVRFAYVAPMLVLCLRVAGKRLPLLEGVLWAFTIAGLVLARFLSEDRQGALITIWTLTYLGALFAVLAGLFSSERHARG
jgi:hypothetical protein